MFGWGRADIFDAIQEESPFLVKMKGVHGPWSPRTASNIGQVVMVYAPLLDIKRVGKVTESLFLDSDACAFHRNHNSHVNVFMHHVHFTLFIM